MDVRTVSGVRVFFWLTNGSGIAAPVAQGLTARIGDWTYCFALHGFRRAGNESGRVTMEFRVALGRMRAALAAALFVVTLTIPGVPVRALAGSELIVADPRGGLALFGFDPVSYFLRGAAEIGVEQFQLNFRDVTWQFRSEANREAFRAQPDVYVPRFGGYDPVALTRGAPVPGHPTLFVIHDGRLYLFQKAEHRETFIATPQITIEAARAYWPNVQRSLVH